MKQHITNKQLIELSFEAGDKLKKWAKKREGKIGIDDDLLLSIGQMIEFLGENYIKAMMSYMPVYEEWAIAAVEPEELCDSLWEAVKEVLNK